MMYEPQRIPWRLGDQVKLRDDYGEPVTGTVMDKSFRKGSNGVTEIVLKITAKGQLYVRSSRQVKRE